MMSDLFWLTDEQMARLQPYFPKSHGRARVDDRRVLSGIIFVNRNGLRWRDAPREYGPAKTLYNRWKRWGDKGIFIRMTGGLAAPQAPGRKTIMIDATYLKAHRTASSLRVKKGGGTPDRPHEGRHEHQAACCDRCEWSSDQLLHDGRSGERLHRRGSTARQSAQGTMASGRPGL
jgi:transposase